MEDKKKKHQHQIKVELDDTVGQGEYVNFAVVTHLYIIAHIHILPKNTFHTNYPTRLNMGKMPDFCPFSNLHILINKG